jgi:ribonucleotide reductase alpha subunit
MMMFQMCAPNSPQWFNTGLKHTYNIEGHDTSHFYWDPIQQKSVSTIDSFSRSPSSACFILSVNDSLFGEQSLTDNITTSAKLFKFGAGIGTNWSRVRGNGELISGGGKSSGVLSFMKVFDANAGTIKSGGTVRRASVMNVLNIDHPDILDYIRWKSREEDKIVALGKMGYDTSMNGDAYDSISGTNVNNSVSITDEFMNLLSVPGAQFKLNGRIDSSVDKEVPVQLIWDELCWAAHRCADPGVQFTDTINTWHTCPNSGRIESSNPCFTGDMHILTKNGYRKFKDIVDQEVIFINADGMESVGTVWTSGVKEVIQLITSTNDVIECTPDHIFMTMDGYEKSAHELLGYQLMPLMNSKPSTYFNTKRIRFGKSFARKYKNLDTLELPASFENWNINEKRSFLRGCFTENGKLSNGGTISYSTPSFNLAMGIINTLKCDFGITAYLMYRPDSDRNYDGEINITSFRDIEKFLHEINFDDNRELLAKDIIKTIAPKVIKIKNIDVHQVYDFKEPLTHWGVVEGVIVHNCSEYLFLNDSACNLGSINVTRFYKDNTFDIEGYLQAVKLMVMMMEGSVHWGSYPTEKVAENSYKYRPLGLGICNLGSLLMMMGVPYDSDEGRNIAAFLMSALTSKAYTTSAAMAHKIGPFEKFEENKEPMLNIIRKHRNAFMELTKDKNCGIFNKEINRIDNIWAQAENLGNAHGYRNAQVSLIAPTGCLSGSTLISTDKGLVRLNDVNNYNGEWQDIDLQVMTDEGAKHADSFYINKIENVVSITTDSGYQINGTLGHKIKIIDTAGQFIWAKLSDINNPLVPLVIGSMTGELNYVTLPKFEALDPEAPKLTTVSKFMNSELAEFIGMYMANGYIDNDTISIEVDKQERELLDRIIHIGKSLFNLEPNMESRTTLPHVDMIFKDSDLVNWFIKCGFNKLSPESKWTANIPHIPYNLRASNDKDIYLAFLKGIYRCAGNRRTTKFDSTSYFVIPNESFAKDIQTMLLAIEIPTKITRLDTAKNRKLFPKYYNQKLFFIRVLQKSFDRFDKIQFISKWKKYEVKHLDKSLFEPVITQIPITADIHSKILNSPDISDRDRAVIERRRLLIPRDFAIRILEFVDIPELEERLKYFYDRVSSKVLLEETETFDIQVPDNHTYIANGFISHNTISFALDSESTAAEPFYSNMIYKRLIDGSYMTLVNGSIEIALKKLNYSSNDINNIMKYIKDNNGMVEGAPNLNPDHLSIFDTAARNGNGKRCISVEGHIKMVGAVQPHISGGQSKTCNIPREATVEDIKNIYRRAWELGCKCITIYRDGCKATQPLSSGLSVEERKSNLENLNYYDLLKYAEEAKIGSRRYLPNQPKCLKDTVEMDGHKFHVIRSFFDDGTLGEIFFTIGKQGNVVKGLQEILCIILSKALQYGVPVDVLSKSMRNHEFGPKGMVYGHPNIKSATSISDLMSKFMDISENNYTYCQVKPDDYEDDQAKMIIEKYKDVKKELIYGKICPVCSSDKIVKAGTCEYCLTCGNSSGCS